MMKSGLNYFGFRYGEFTSIGWQSTSQEVTRMMRLANNQAAQINTLFQTIQFKDLLKKNQKFFTDAMLAPAKLEKAETEKRLLLEKSLKRDAIRVRP